MSDERQTAEQSDALPFEDRVFARFDALDARLTKLEEAAEQKAMETKPIWERALAEIMAARKEIEQVNARLGRIEARLDSLERKVKILNDDILAVRADLAGMDARVSKMEESKA